MLRLNAKMAHVQDRNLAVTISQADVDIPARVARLLDRALSRRASDVHLDPTAQGYDVRFRIDGLLETVEQLRPEVGRAVVTRLMVMAQMLTYRLDVPQEGRAEFVPPTGG